MKSQKNRFSCNLAVAMVLLVSAASSAFAVRAGTQPTAVGSLATVPEIPTLFIIGDSTVHDSAAGEQGWGDAIKPMFDATRIKVVNRATGSSSSRSFRTEGHWNDVLATAKPGDFVLIQFGHNDSASLDNSGEHGSIPGIGPETRIITKADGTTETVHSFGWYMQQYIIEAKAKGMTPIICSYIPRCPRPSNGNPATMPSIPFAPVSYSLYAKEIAEKEAVDFINLNGIIWLHYAAFAPQELKRKFFSEADYTHTSPAGAVLNAQCAVEGIRQLKDSTLKGYLLPSPPAGDAIPKPA